MRLLIGIGLVFTVFAANVAEWDHPMWQGLLKMEREGRGDQAMRRFLDKKYSIIDPAAQTLCIKRASEKLNPGKQCKDPNCVAAGKPHKHQIIARSATKSYKMADGTEMACQLIDIQTCGWESKEKKAAIEFIPSAVEALTRGCRDPKCKNPGMCSNSIEVNWGPLIATYSRSDGKLSLRFHPKPKPAKTGCQLIGRDTCGWEPIEIKRAIQFIPKAVEALSRGDRAMCKNPELTVNWGPLTATYNRSDGNLSLRFHPKA